MAFYCTTKSHANPIRRRKERQHLHALNQPTRRTKTKTNKIHWKQHTNKSTTNKRKQTNKTELLN